MKEIQLLGLLLFVVILILCFVKVIKEGFSFETTKKQHDLFSEKYSKKYSNVGVMLTSAKNEAALGSSTRDIFGSVQDTMDANNNIKQSIDDPFPAEGGVSGMSLVIKQCEVVKTADCSVFDKPAFSKNCGLCLDFGTDSEGKPQIGGMVLTAKDKEYGKSQQKGNFLAPYAPTVGTCPTGMMVANKAECVRLQNELTCKKGGTMDTPAGCSQCFDDGVYHVVDSKADPSLVIGTGILMIVGSGTLTWSESGTSNTGTIILSPTKVKPVPLAGPEFSAINLDLVSPPLPKPYDASKIYNVNDLIIFKSFVYKMRDGAGVPGFDPSREGDQLWTKLMPYAQYVPPPPAFIAGYLQAPDGNSFQPMDLYRLVLNDSMTGRKPRTMGQLTLDSVVVTNMGLGYGKKTMKLVAYSPFTFVDNLSQEASLCPNSPYITTPASARFMSSDPCYARGTGPGNYNLACLQQTFRNNGCGTSLASLAASGYPSTAEKAAGLLTDTEGKELSLDEIAAKIYQYALSTTTGLDANGKKLSMDNWSAASVFCTGVPINSPCDAVDEEGRLTDDCIVYLWDNQGENKIPKNTYSLTSFARSLFNTGTINRFCTRDGTYSPMDSSNKPNLVNLEYWKNKGNGSVTAVKAAMSQLHLDANTNLTREDAKAPFVKQCYGIVPNPRPGFKSNFTPDLSVQQKPSGLTKVNGKAQWRWLTCSSDGSIFVGTEFGNIYFSRDKGQSWTTGAAAGKNTSYMTIACSADASKMILATYGGPVYLSTNTGSTWTTISSPGMSGYGSVGCSADGTTMYAVFQGAGVYVSRDSGATWKSTSISSAASAWTAVACSSDGKIAVVTSYNGGVYTTADAGETWTKTPLSNGQMWFSATCSTSGNKMAVSSQNGVIFTFSSGSWNKAPISPSAGWNGYMCITGSGSGSILIATSWPGGITVSSDGGASWTALTNNPLIHGYAAVSSDGSIALIGDFSLKNVYQYVPPAPGAGGSTPVGLSGAGWSL